MSEKKGGGRRSGGAEEEEGTDNFWIQRSRNPTQNFVHPEAEGSPNERFFFTTMHENPSRPVPASPCPRVYFQLKRRNASVNY
ncbi:MAG: hypothetical protein F6J96_27525 [Symploca sp. SIO1C2]|nr:hypothetical protein [Symploca sp. SIO1C2]